MELFKKPLYILSIFLFSCGTETTTEQTLEAETIPKEVIVQDTAIKTTPLPPVVIADTTIDASADIEEQVIESKESATTVAETIEVIKPISDIPLPVGVKEIKEEETVTNIVAPVTTQPIEVTKEIPELTKVVFTHQLWDDILRKNVTASGNVNYASIDKTKLKEYLQLLSNNEPQSSWSKNKKLAFWINAYNAFMIDVILKNNIPKSVMDINGGKAWDLKVAKIGSKTYSLNDIEHTIIRKQFNEPRIHFACVCAAKSCPKLLNKAYTASNLNSSLNYQTKYFINNKAKNEITDKDLKVSQLFNWYGSDFGDINTYIAKYANKEFKKDKNIEFMDYDWSLNK